MTKPLCCPICNILLENPRIGFCRDCYCFRPGSAKSQSLGVHAPRYACQHCSTADQPNIIPPLEVGKSQPTHRKGVLNIPPACPYCETPNPCAPASRYSPPIASLLTAVFWGLPLFCLVFLWLGGSPETPWAALDKLAAPLIDLGILTTSHNWHGFPDEHTRLQATKPFMDALTIFSAWVPKAIPLYVLLPWAWLLAARERCAVMRKVRFVVTEPTLLGFAGSLGFALWYLWPILTNLSAVFVVPIAIGLGLAAAMYTVLMMLLDRYLPLLGLAAFSIYNMNWLYAGRKIKRAFDFINIITEFPFDFECKTAAATVISDVLDRAWRLFLITCLCLLYKVIGARGFAFIAASIWFEIYKAVAMALYFIPLVLLLIVCVLMMLVGLCGAAMFMMMLVDWLKNSISKRHAAW